jgi:hypothetical protein
LDLTKEEVADNADSDAEAAPEEGRDAEATAEPGDGSGPASRSSGDDARRVGVRRVSHKSSSEGRRHDSLGDARSGSVNLITTLKGEPYWASVVVDGVRKGNTPLLVDLPPGRHTIRFERTGFQTVSRQIKVASGRSRVLRVELTP